MSQENVWQPLAAQLRADSIRCTTAAGSGHPTSGMSAADLMAVLQASYLKYDFANPKKPNNDHLIFSKGHACPVLYAMYKAAGAMTDEELLGHIAFFDAAFPKYEMFADEITAEGNRVVVRARMKGCHEGEFNGILPTHRKVELPFVISYDIENGKIVHHWLIADQIVLMEQLGVMN